MNLPKDPNSGYTPPMYAYPVEFEPFTEDELERQQLKATYLEPTSATDSYTEEVERISAQLATLARSLPQKHRKAIEYYFRGHTKAEITQETGIVHQTIQRALDSPKGLHFLSLLSQLEELRRGPTLEARRAMLWRIAQRAELTHPSTAIRALDTLEKQAGTYRPQEQEVIDTGIVIRTAVFNVTNNNFTLEQDTPPPPAEQPPIEGEFTPIKVPLLNAD